MTCIQDQGVGVNNVLRTGILSKFYSTNTRQHIKLFWQFEENLVKGQKESEFRASFGNSSHEMQFGIFFLLNDRRCLDKNRNWFRLLWLD